MGYKETLAILKRLLLLNSIERPYIIILSAKYKIPCLLKRTLFRKYSKDKAIALLTLL